MLNQRKIKKNSTVLITGASKGLGEALVKELDQRGCHFILIARNKAALLSLQKKVKGQVQIVAGDLTNEEFLKQIEIILMRQKVDYLINNAGIGDYGWFQDGPRDKQILLLNSYVPSQLMKYYLRGQKEGRILNIISIAACQSDPLMAQYGATKAYLWQLSKSIQIELKKQKSNIKIINCLPGSFDSNFNRNAHVPTPLKGKTSHQIAKEIVRGIEKDQSLILPVLTNRLAYYLGKLIPEKVMDEIEWIIQKQKG